MPPVHHATRALCPLNVVPLERYAPGTLCPRNTMPPGHYSTATLCPRNTVPSEYYALGSLHPRNTVPIEHYASGLQCCWSTMPTAYHAAETFHPQNTGPSNTVPLEYCAPGKMYPGTLCPRNNLHPEHFAPESLCRRNTVPPEHYASGTLCPLNTMPPEHCAARALCPRSTVPVDHYFTGTLHPGNIVPLQHYAPGSLCPRNTVPPEDYAPRSQRWNTPLQGHDPLFLHGMAGAVAGFWQNLLNGTTSLAHNSTGVAAAPQMSGVLFDLAVSAQRVCYSLVSDGLNLAARPLALVTVWDHGKFPTLETMLEGGLLSGLLCTISAVLIAVSVAVLMGRTAGEVLWRMALALYAADGVMQLPTLLHPAGSGWYSMSRTGFFATVVQVLCPPRPLHLPCPTTPIGRVTLLSSKVTPEPEVPGQGGA